jgi:hypothetical protein
MLNSAHPEPEIHARKNTAELEKLQPVSVLLAALSVRNVLQLLLTFSYPIANSCGNLDFQLQPQVTT